MLPVTTAATKVFASSLAVNAPLVGLVAGAGIGIWQLMRRVTANDEAKKARSRFMRALARTEIPSDVLIKFNLYLDPIEAAKEAIRTDDPHAKHLRAALCEVL